MTTSISPHVEVDVDLDLEIPCEDRQHGNRVPGADGPARYRIRWSCPGCSRIRVVNVCATDYNWLTNKFNLTKCSGCGCINPADTSTQLICVL